MTPIGFAMFVVWIAFGAAAAALALYQFDRHNQRLQLRACEDLLTDKGIERKPGESVKQAMLRHRKEESTRPSAYAKNLSRHLRPISGGRASYPDLARITHPDFPARRR